MTPPKYILKPPEDLHPYITRKSEEFNDFSSNKIHNIDKKHINDESRYKSVYPDFEPWKHKKEEDQIFLNFVSKGYYTTSKVNFESISARSSLHGSLPKISDQLSERFSEVLQIREEKINKIPVTVSDESFNSINPLAGPGFALPNRVTLTDNRKEAWLQDLSSPYVSLNTLSKYIPHGLKRRQVIEQCYTKQIPIKRAMWLIKCCYMIEMQGLKSKHLHSRSNSAHGIIMSDTNFTSSSPSTPISTSPSFYNGPNSTDSSSSTKSPLYKEWTDNFINILEKLIFEMNQYYNDSIKLKVWKREISYFLKLLGNCYSSNLLDKEVFNHWLIEFVAKVENFEFLPLTLHILIIFWDSITNPGGKNNELDSQNTSTFLLSKLTDTLLHKYYIISNAKSMINDEKYIINDIKKNAKIKESLMGILTNLIIRLFEEQSLEVFLFPPSSWELYKPCLHEITNKLCSMKNGTEIRKILELISYRNETLKNTTLLTDDKKDSNTETTTFEKQKYFTTSSIDAHLKIIRIPNLNTKFTTLLDDNPTDFDWTQYVEQNSLNKTEIIQLILWSIHPSRISHYESNQLVAKLLLLQINSFDGFPEYEIEDTLWSLIFQIAKLDTKNLQDLVHSASLYQLLNILITYGIIKVSTYIRKLISSGILYLQDSNDKVFHVILLVNLKISPLMRSQYNMVLRNVMEYDPKFYNNYNFDNLQTLVDQVKDKLINNEDNKVILSKELDNIPFGGKILIAEWYLNYLCSGTTLQSVDKEILLRNFRIFCVDLKFSHHFYKWVEFIVYHQLLGNIEAMELLIDILIRYQKLFTQFINDYVLFMKTFIFIYSNILKEKDSINYQIVSFMPFWKFFMKNFRMTLIIDNDLRNELSAIYEEEKNKTQSLEQNKELVRILFNSVNERDIDSWLNSNFVEAFQGNMKTVLSYKVRDSLKEFKRSKTILHLLNSYNLRDYNKFMAIFLKRKNFTDEDLICLISNKLLGLDQIKNTLGIELVLKLLGHLEEHIQQLSKDDTVYYFNIIYYEFYMDEYCKNNFQTILSSCERSIPEQYNLFLELLIKYGPSSRFIGTSTKMIADLLKNNPSNVFEVLCEILNRNKAPSDSSDNITEGLESDLNKLDCGKLFDKTNNCVPYIFLDFTNLWIFQAYTQYQIEEISKKEDYSDALKQFILEMIEATQQNELCSKIFDQVSDITVIEEIIKIFELHFFNRILNEDKILRNCLIIYIESIISLSKKVTETNSTGLPMTDVCLRLLMSIISRCSSMTENALMEMEPDIDVLMKIFTIHQTYILQYMVDALQDKLTQDSMLTFIDDLFDLFDKLSFSLRLKLILYEILSSLKSYCIYVANTGRTNSNKVAAMSNHNSTNILNKLYAAKSNNNLAPASKNTKFKVPKRLLSLPPLQVSSFTKKSCDSEMEEELSLGISPMDNQYASSSTPEEGKDRWFLYNKNEKAYTSKLKTEPFYNINNYQTNPNPIKSINNACLNLGLFDANFENENPK